MASVINMPLNLHISSDVNDNLNLSQWQKRENHHSCPQLAAWRSVFVQSYSTAFGVPLQEFLFQCMHKGCGFGSFLFLRAVRKRILLKSYLHSNIHWRNRVVILDFFFAVSIDSIKGFPVILTSWIKWHTLLVKYSLPEKQKFSFNDKLFVSRYVRRLLTGHHCPQIGEGERGFFRRRREMKVGKSPQASNVCLLSWTMSPASHNSSGSRKRRGDDRGWESSAGVCGPLHARPPHPQEAPAGSHTCCRPVPVWVPGIGNTGGNRCPPTHCFHKSAKTKTKQDLENGGEGLSWEKMWFMGRKSALMRGRKCRKEKGRRREVWQREPSRHCLYSLVSTIFISIICYSETFRIFTGLKMIHLKRHSTARLQLV